MLSTVINILSDNFPYIAVTLAVWITYIYTLRCGFCSDDIMGIAEYDGRLQGFQYGMLSRWIRYHITGGNFPSSKKLPNGQIIPSGKLAYRHHFISVLVFNLACLGMFQFFQSLFGLKLALLTVILFAFHPICTQAVAWISGLGYPLSLLWMSCALNLIQWYSGHSTPTNSIWVTLLFCLLQFLAIHAQFATMGMCVILAFLGYWQFAILGGLISFVMGFDIIRQTIGMRTAEFKRQQMGHSTFLSPRKIIVAIKTVLYYLKFTVWPNRMGLYHEWGFHYEPAIERESPRFWIGLIAFAGLIAAFFLVPIPSIKLSILWFLAFSIIFWNWITIQQFVTERYIFIPTIGTCLLVATLTQDYLYIYALIAGLALMRTWLFLPTYDDELRYYQSNHWHFKNSEVALGNLGVTYMRIGMNGTAVDTWQHAIRINPDYDVPYYNIFSTYRQNGYMMIQHGDYNGGLKILAQGLPYLEKTISCKVCHFPDMWKKEVEELRHRIKNPIIILNEERTRLTTLLKQFNDAMPTTAPDKIMGLQVSINDTSKQLERLESFIQNADPNNGK